MLGERLTAAGYTRRIDPTIVMEHISPGDLRSFWKNQIWRASFSSPFAYYFRKLSVTLVALRETAKALRTVLLGILVVPTLARAAGRVKFARRGWRSFPGLVAADLVRDAASIVGNFRGLRAVVKARRAGPSVT
jgi:hypothetical protein